MSGTNGKEQFQLLERQIKSFEPRISDMKSASKLIRDAVTEEENQFIIAQLELSNGFVSVLSDLVTVIAGLNDKLNFTKDELKNYYNKILFSIWGSIFAFIAVMVTNWLIK